MKWRALLVGAALIAGSIGIVGCAQQYAGGQGVSPVEVSLKDGRTVACVVASSGGVDCDWDNAR